jgi:hypothetical protein
MEENVTVRSNAISINVLAVAIALILYRMLFVELWEVEVPPWVKGTGMLPLFVLAIAVLVAHEGIHALTARLLSRESHPRISIHLLTWQCNLQGPLTKAQYIVYSLAPGLLLGTLGLLILHSSTSIDLRLFAATLFLCGVSSGTGDYWFVARVLRFPSSSLVYDHGIEIEIVATKKPLL